MVLRGIGCGGVGVNALTVLVRRASVAALVRRLVFAMRLSCGLRQLWGCHCRNPAIGSGASGAGGAGTRSVPFSGPQECSVRAHSPVGCAQRLDVPPLCSGKGSSAGLQDQQLKGCRAKFMRRASSVRRTSSDNRSFDDVVRTIPLTGWPRQSSPLAGQNGSI